MLAVDDGGEVLDVDDGREKGKGEGEVVCRGFKKENLLPRKACRNGGPGIRAFKFCRVSTVMLYARFSTTVGGATRNIRALLLHVEKIYCRFQHVPYHLAAFSRSIAHTSSD